MELEHLPLSQVIDEFKEWRASRVKQSRIPDHLWKHVIPLLSDHLTPSLCNSEIQRLT